MKIKRLVIENFKSIKRIELTEPNPFTVFVGPNGSGKSNIFEALEFVNLSSISPDYSLEEVFGKVNDILHRQLPYDRRYLLFECEFESFRSSYVRYYNAASADKYTGVKLPILVINSEDASNPLGSVHTQSSPTNFFFSQLNNLIEKDTSVVEDIETFFRRFSRLFVGNINYEKLNKRGSDIRLSLAATNLEPVLKRILTNKVLRDEIFEWLDLFVPGFKAVEIDDRNELHWFEESSPEYFTKDLISDGTYNILALLTAVYQSDDKPQFLCIEEPENGLHPQVLMTLVEFFRKQCEEKGHYIWLNTHSESLVRGLTTDEIVLVNKREGATQTRQIKGRNIYNIPTDEAWLTGALGGGLPW